MSEISKLYDNANIKICKRKQGFTLKDCTDRDCKECGYYDMPPFTAEKQLKLIEFMLKKYGEETIGFELWKDNSYHAMCHLGYDGFENYADSNTLCGAIAGLITLYWQDLTEEEKASIKNILEM